MAKAIMIQGTASNAGKSLLTAGLCRIFKEDGYKVAPFKSQNMALNSYITAEGLEMGRAQVMQAEAASIAPSVLMNPILLKPTTDMGSQVIVKGEVLGQMSAAEYFAQKRELLPIVSEAYAELAARHDIIVIEGAGSPAEINLMEDDIVNMGMARLAQAPVLLAGDIDRGGVFAALYGTLALLPGEDRARVKGLIINKFRGDVEILRPGLEQLEALTGLPVLGVVPYLNLDIDDEDSLSERLHTAAPARPLDIAVIRLPRLSNFTDFNSLTRLGAVGLRYVSSAASLGSPDLMILPGTKNTMGDLRWLYDSGLAEIIQSRAAQGALICGICGGYQMLGLRLSDPLGLEEGGSMPGLDLLPVNTVFAPQKTRTQVGGRVRAQGSDFAALSGSAFSGYEIHMGQSVPNPGTEAFAELDNGSLDGAARGNVCGSYIHGLFDGEAGRALTQMLLRRKGLSDILPEISDISSYKDQQYRALAAALRASLDLPAIYHIMGVK